MAAGSNGAIQVKYTNSLILDNNTKFKCDGSFGLINKLYRKTTVNHIVERSSTARLNKAQCYKSFQYLNLNT